MRNFILKIFLFSILFVLVNYIYLATIKSFDWNFKKRIESINLDSPKYDVLILGNSLPMDGVDADLLSQSGFPAYNLAIGGASLKTNYIQLKEYLSNYDHKPQYIILGMGSYIGSFDNEKLHPIVDFTRTSKIFTLNDIPIIKFKWLFTELLKKIVSKDHREAYLNKGQLRFNKTTKDNSSLDENQEFPLKDYTSSAEILSLLKLCESNNITLIVIEMPGFKKVRHQKKFNCVMLDEEFNNGFLLDYNTIQFGETFDDEKDWIGDNHLNEVGAKKFTKFLLNDLKKIDSNNMQCKPIKSLYEN